MRFRGNWQQHRWFVLAVVAVGINGAGVVGAWHKSANREEPIVFRGDQNEPVRGHESLVWRFPTDQVGPDWIGVAAREGPYVLNPPVDGEWTWVDPRRLVFRPDEPWPPCHQYVARRPVAPASDPGEDGHERTPFTFHSAPLQVRNISPAVVVDSYRSSFSIDFNAPPDRDLLEHYLIVLDERGNRRRFTTSGVRGSSTVLVRATARRETSLTVHLRKGLPPAEGDGNLDDDVIQEIPVEDTFVLRFLTSRTRAIDDMQVEAGFSMTPEPTGIRESLTIDPPLDYQVVRTGSLLRFSGPFRAGATYHFSFGTNLCAVGGRALTEPTTRTITIPSPGPSIALPGRGVYLSGAGKRLVPFHVVNTDQVTVTAERIYPNNLLAYVHRTEGRAGYYYSRRRAMRQLSQLTGRRAFVTTAGVHELTTRQIDMTDLMGGNEAGAFWITARTEEGPSASRLIVVSDLGIGVRQSDNRMMGWINSLRTARPVAGADVRVVSETNQEMATGFTDAEGRFDLPLRWSSPEEPPALILVAKDRDQNYLSLGQQAVRRQGDLGGAPYPEDGYEASILMDRGIYRPGETGRVYVVVRRADLSSPEPFPVTLVVRQPDEQRLLTTQTLLSELGTAPTRIAWPEHAATGRYRLEVLVPGREEPIGVAHATVEMFVPPEIAVDLATESTRLTVVTPLTFDVTARHLFGPPAAGLRARGAVVFRPAPFHPAGWDGYQFGDSTKPFRGRTTVLGERALDAEGRTRFETRIPDDIRPPAALRVLLQGKVSESSGRAISGYASRNIDVYPFYVGLHPRQSGWLRVGEPITFDIAAVAHDGSAMEEAPPLQAELLRLEWSSTARESHGGVTYESTLHRQAVESESVGLEAGRGRLELIAPQTGQYEVLVHDPESGVATRHRLYVSRTGSHDASAGIRAPDEVHLALDQPVYRPGDTALLRIEAPFTGQALLTIESDRVLHSQVATLTNRVHEWSVPVEAAYLPNVYCCLTLIRPVTGGDDLHASFRATGVIPLVVEDPNERLALAIHAPETLRPKGSLSVTLSVTDADGQGVEAEVVLAAVDEGICRLTGFETPDPLAHFRRKRALGTRWVDLYGRLMEEAGPDVEASASSPPGDQSGLLAGRLNPIRARRFRPTALYAGPIRTDARGHVELTLEVPEFTGTLRLMAVAIAPTRMGSAAHSVVVKRPLVVRSSLPRFMAPGDRCTMPVDIFNETGAARDVQIQVKTSGPLSVVHPPDGLTLAAGEHGIRTVDIQAGTAVGVGTVRLSVTCPGESYRESFELAVRPVQPRLRRTEAGRVDPGARTPLLLPTDWLAGTEEFHLWCSGLPSLSLAGGLDYLLRYPYGCVEQTTSSAFPLLVLADLAAAVTPGRITPEDTAHKIEAGISRLLSMQHPNGGFATYPGTRTQYPWGSVYAGHFLVEAAALGHPVPADRLAALHGYLGDLLNRSTQTSKETEEPWREDRVLRAYACRVLARAGKPTRGWIDRLLEEEQRLPLDARLHLAAALADNRRPADGARLLAAIPIEHCLETKRKSSGSLDSPPRSLALLLSAWLRIDPVHPATGAAVQRLQDTRSDGRWATTQENAMALLALGEYVRLIRDQATETRGVVQCDSHRHEVAGKDVLHLQSPDCDLSAVRIHNQGESPLLYHWSSGGVPTDDNIRAHDQSVRIRRSYLDADLNPLDLSAVRQGDSVHVELEVTPIGLALENLVITDLLPAGLEIEPTRREEPDRRRGRTPVDQSRLNVEHQDPRDDRILLFTGRVSATARHRYLTRAVTPGRYRIPAVHVEGMYNPGLSSLQGGGAMQVHPYQALEVSP